MLSLKEKLIYSCGNLGISLITVIHMLFLVFVFFPSDSAGIPYLIPQKAIFFGATIIGVVLFLSRILDAFTDPLIANISDRSKNKNGKRIPFMRRFAAPMAIAYIAVFLVPVSSGISYVNVAWLFFWMILVAIFLTLYSVPYYTLMITMAQTPEDKIDLGTFSSSFWFVGFLIVSFSTGLWELIEVNLHVSRLQSIQITFCILGVLGTVLMLIPAYFIKESNYADIKVANIGIKESAKVVASNKNYRFFFLANTVYSVATFIFETGLIYYITVLALQKESVQGPLTTVIGAMTLACYPIINIIAKKKGKKPVMIIGFGLFALSFVVITCLGLGGTDPWILLSLVVLLSPFSQAAFGILPGVITADCAAQDLHRTKVDKSGMYIAATGFSQKLGGSIATIIFTSLLLFGKDVGDDLGIRLATVFGAILACAGLLFMKFYNEQEILKHTKIKINKKKGNLNI